jgi:hypothetical protein
MIDYIINSFMLIHGSVNDSTNPELTFALISYIVIALISICWVVAMSIVWVGDILHGDGYSESAFTAWKMILFGMILPYPIWILVLALWYAITISYMYLIIAFIILFLSYPLALKYR